VFSPVTVSCGIAQLQDLLTATEGKFVVLSDFKAPVIESLGQLGLWLM
jgi:hypothetical protein